MMAGIYTEVVGDVTLPQDAKNTIVLPHVCNNIGAFGAGVAGSIADRWPHVQKKYFDFCHRFDPDISILLGMVQFVYADMTDMDNRQRIYVANMFAMDGVRSAKNRSPLVMAHLKTCMADVVHTAKGQFGKEFEIHCPKFGTVLAGGSWKKIRPLIDALWIESGINVTVYNFGG